LWEWPWLWWCERSLLFRGSGSSPYQPSVDSPGGGGSSRRATPIRGGGASGAFGEAADDEGKLAGSARGAHPTSAERVASRARTPAVERAFRGADGDLGIGLSSVVTHADALPPRPLQPFLDRSRDRAHLRGSTTITPFTMFMPHANGISPGLCAGSSITTGVFVGSSRRIPSDAKTTSRVQGE